MAQWIRPQTVNREVPSSNLLAAAVVPLGQGTLSSLPSPFGKDLMLLGAPPPLKKKIYRWFPTKQFTRFFGIHKTINKSSYMRCSFLF